MTAVKRGIVRFICGLADMHDYQFHLKVPVEHVFPSYEMSKRWLDVVLTDEKRKVVAVFNVVSSSYGHSDELAELVRAVDEDSYPIHVYNFTYCFRSGVIDFRSRFPFIIGERLFMFPNKFGVDFWKSFDPDGYDYGRHEIRVGEAEDNGSGSPEDEDN